MLSEKFVNRTDLLNWIKKEVTLFCELNNMSPIPVHYGHIPNRGDSKAVFAYPPPRIIVWEGYSKWLGSFTPYQRVWHVNHAIFHELWHNRQFLFAKSRKLKITKDIFDEDETYNQGDVQADKVAGTLTPEEINPIRRNVLPEIASSAISGVGLGVGFKVADKLWNVLGKKKNPEIRTATRVGYSYGGKPVFYFDNEYWYLVSRHKKMSTALDLNKKHPAHIRKANGWYGRFYGLPKGVSALISRRTEL